jgi:DNA-binding NarL/FixJ family response regulator
MIRVLIVDDHPIVHEGVTASLERTPDIRVVRAVTTVAEAVTAVTQVKPDVILLDVRLDAGEAGTADSLSIIPALAGAWAAARVLMFSAHDADALVVGALRAGASGYVLKGTPASELAIAIRRVHAGESYLSPSLASTLIEQLQRRSHGARLLTARELMVLQLLAAGLSNRAIAGSLDITERTVKFHVTSILTKLGADNRTQAVAMARRRGMVEG